MRQAWSWPAALFCLKFGLNGGAPRKFNQWYIETDPVQTGEDYVGFQAKYYVSPTVKDDQERVLATTVRNVHDKYPKLTILQIYLANEFSDRRDSVIPKRQAGIEKVAEDYANKHSVLLGFDCDSEPIQTGTDIKNAVILYSMP